jgi:hypothetical protein
VTFKSAQYTTSLLSAGKRLLTRNQALFFQFLIAFENNFHQAGTIQWHLAASTIIQHALISLSSKTTSETCWDSPEQKASNWSNLVDRTKLSFHH